MSGPDELTIHPIVAVTADDLQILMQRAASLEEAFIQEEGWLNEDVEDVKSISVPLARKMRGRSSSPGHSRPTKRGRSLDRPAWQSAHRQVIASAYSRLYHAGEDPPTGPPPSPSRSPSKERRFLKRLAQKIQKGHFVKPKVRAKLIRPTLAIPAIPTPITREIRATVGGYQGKIRKDRAVPLFRTLKDLIDAEYKFIPWDGKTPRPLIDSEDNVFGALAGRPNDEEWLAACDRLYDAMASEASQVQFDDKYYTHRGEFPAINVGLTPGQGSKYPHNIGLGPYEGMMTRLLENPDLQYIADHHSWCLKLWSPGLYDRYKTGLDRLHCHPRFGEGLKRLTPAGVFPTAAFNFGPNVWTNPHCDVKNYGFGWCVIQPLGPFNSKTGGHVIFDDLKQVVEFPAGSIIMIPSATLSHANVPVVEGQRASFTQYFPGGLLRFVDNNFRVEERLKKTPKGRDELRESSRRVADSLPRSYILETMGKRKNKNGVVLLPDAPAPVAPNTLLNIVPPQQLQEITTAILDKPSNVPVIEKKPYAKRMSTKMAAFSEEVIEGIQAALVGLEGSAKVDQLCSCVSDRGDQMGFRNTGNLSRKLMPRTPFIMFKNGTAGFLNVHPSVTLDSLFTWAIKVLHAHRMPTYPVSLLSYTQMDCTRAIYAIAIANLYRPETVFTFAVLKYFHRHSLSSKMNLYDYCNALRKDTNAAFPDRVPRRFENNEALKPFAPIISKIRGAIPKMHISGHGIDCQINESFLYMPYSEMTCGEGIEVPGLNKTSLQAQRKNKTQVTGMILSMTITATGNHLLAQSKKCSSLLSKRLKTFNQWMSLLSPELTIKWRSMTAETHTKMELYMASTVVPTREKNQSSLLEDAAEASKHGGTPIVEFISLGIQTEDMQENLKAKSQSEDSVVDRSLLLSMLHKWRADQHLLFPSLRPLPLIDDTCPEDVPLHLPSSYSDSQRMQLRLSQASEIERKIRHACAFDALASLRNEIHRFNREKAKKKSGPRSQKINTRSQKEFREIEANKEVYRGIYMRMYEGLRALGNKDETLKPLLKKEMWGKNMGGAHVTGDSSRKDPWFWWVGKPEDMSEKNWAVEWDRVHWMREKAAIERLEEEVELIEEEFRRTTLSFKKMGEVWTKLAGHPDDKPSGYRCYAFRMAEMYQQLAESCEGNQRLAYGYKDSLGNVATNSPSSSRGRLCGEADSLHIQAETDHLDRLDELDELGIWYPMLHGSSSSSRRTTQCSEPAQRLLSDALWWKEVVNEELGEYE
ncbi:hypothetical protein NP233_g5573 [Leucocoprinus birnbaumii]|uniref:CxC2-like cysteine cluster KDZ transposase-associated domain-containing protein n=1 Tax=Leucocoprinus birnbaumii TaxID=56174 RepID=A0AAD5YRS0_9AGAR|nr:hypothetical protein NP233_g5573 [Leucocoprinus birnbaumii]